MSGKSAAAVAISILIIAVSLILGSAVYGAEEQSASIYIYTSGPSAGLEFFIELPPGVKFVSFELSRALEMPNIQFEVSNPEQGGIQIGIFTDWNGYFGDGGSIKVGTLVISSATARPAISITDAISYRYSYSHEVIISTAGGAVIFPAPQESAEEPSPSVSPSPEPSPSPSPEPTTSPEPYQEPCPFTDLNEVKWAADAIEFLWREYGFEGIGDNKFGASLTITRAQFARFLTVTLELPKGDADTKKYSDVNPGSWYYDDVTALTGVGALEGYPDGLFKPNNQITREEMAVMLDRTLNLIGYNTVPVRPFMLTDIELCGKWSREPVRRLYRAGFIEGVSLDRFSPKTNATRAQAAVMIYRIILAVRQGGNPNYLYG
jgi:hypothetical protein